MTTVVYSVPMSGSSSHRDGMFPESKHTIGNLPSISTGISKSQSSLVPL